MNNLKVTRKNLVLMTGLALIVIMAVGVVNAWPWSVTGKAVIKSGDEINLYDGDEYEFEFNGDSYKITDMDINFNGDEIKFVLGDRAYYLFVGEELTSDDGLTISLLYIDKTFWRKMVGKDPYRARVKISVAKKDIPKSTCQLGNCILVEGAEVEPIIGNAGYKFSINFIDNEKVKLVIGNDFITPKLIEGQTYNYIDKFYVNIQRIIKEDYVGGPSYVMFSVSEIGENTTEPTSEEVTYAGVLEMLGKCTYDNVELGEYPISCSKKCAIKDKIALSSFVIGQYRTKDDSTLPKSYSSYFVNTFDIQYEWSDIDKVIEELIEENLNGVANSGDISLVCQCCSAP